MKKLKMAIIGHGFVGKAVDFGFPDDKCEKTLIDPLYLTFLKDIPQDVQVCFVCVPTPMGKGGAIDSSIVEETVTYLKNNLSCLIVIKSTVIPSVIKELASGLDGYRVIYNPEFLTERNANNDFVNPPMHIFGGDEASTYSLQQIYDVYSNCARCKIFRMSPTEASFVKYGINCFLATKVLWFNQFYDVVQKEGANYGTIINAISGDPRIGSSHTLVPGFDGKRGFGGACFPKDTSAFSNYAEDFTVLAEAIAANNEYRKNYKKDHREEAQNVEYV